MKRIVLTKGLSSVVDDKVYPLLVNMNWYAAKCRNGYYAKNNRYYLHHYVAGFPLNGLVVDHINGDTLDNRLENLRLVTHRQNCMNAKSHRSGKLGGAFRDRGNGRWYARIQINGVRRSIGSFATEKDAHEAYLNIALSPINSMAVSIPV